MKKILVITGLGLIETNSYELPEGTEMYQKGGQWWWKSFFSIDGVKVDNPVRTDYSAVYEDECEAVFNETELTKELVQ